jgi:hypothetical protein
VPFGYTLLCYRYCQAPFYTFYLPFTLSFESNFAKDAPVMLQCLPVLIWAGIAILRVPRSDTTSVIIPDSTPDATHRTASVQLAASFSVQTSRLQRPSIRAGSGARHPILYASFDESRKVLRRRPHLYDGLLRRPGIFTGRLHQHQGLGMTSHRNSAYPSLSTAPSGKTPVSRKRQRAMSNLRATATMPIRLRRLPPPPNRSRNHTLRALSG